MKVLVSKDDLHEAIFGSFDGIMTTLGVAIGLASSPKAAILAGTVGAAAAGAVSMGAGEYLGDEQRSKHRALVMAIATLVGTILPITPLAFLPKVPGFVVAGILTIVATGSIAWVRKKWLETFAVLLTVAGLTTVISLLVGVS